LAILLFVGVAAANPAIITVQEVNTGEDFEDGKLDNFVVEGDDLVHDEAGQAAQYTSKESDGEITQAKINYTVTGVGDIVTFQLQYFDGQEWQTYKTATEDNEAEEEAKKLNVSDQSQDEWRVFVESAGSDNVIHDHDFSYETSEPTVENEFPSNEEVDSLDFDFTFDLEDPDLETQYSDTVEYEVFVNGEEIESDEISENKTVEVESDNVDYGDNEWYVTGEDEIGNEFTSDTFEFSAPNQIEIRDVKTNELIDDAEVTLEFFSGEVVIEETTEDGLIDMSGLDAGETLVVTVQAEGYHDRTSIIDSVFSQQNIYLLEDSDEIDDANVVFELEDYSGQFDSAESQLRIERPVDVNGERSWKVVGGERFGAAGEVTETLEINQRYRLVIENEDGLTRSLGDYTPTEDVVTTLEVGSIEWAAETDTYRWNADYKADETGHNVEWIIESDPNELENIDVELTDQLSGDLIAEEFEEGPVSDYSTQFDVPEEYENRTLVIEWTADKNGEEISGSRAIGDRPPTVDNPFEEEWALLVVGLILMGVGLLFGGAFGAIGALMVSMTAGVLWWLGWLEVGVGIVLLALIVSVLYVLGGER